MTTPSAAPIDRLSADPRLDRLAERGAHMLARVRRDAALDRAWRGAMRASVVAGGIALAIAWLSRAAPFVLLAGWVAVVGMAAVIVFVRQAQGPGADRDPALQAVDRDLRLGDRLSASDQFARLPAPGGFEVAAIVEASPWIERALAAPPRRAPRSPRAGRSAGSGVAGVALLVAALIVSLLPVDDGTGGERSPAVRIAQAVTRGRDAVRGAVGLPALPRDAAPGAGSPAGRRDRADSAGGGARAADSGRQGAAAGLGDGAGAGARSADTGPARAARADGASAMAAASDSSSRAGAGGDMAGAGEALSSEERGSGTGDGRIAEDGVSARPDDARRANAAAQAGAAMPAAARAMPASPPRTPPAGGDAPSGGQQQQQSNSGQAGGRSNAQGQSSAPGQGEGTGSGRGAGADGAKTARGGSSLLLATPMIDRLTGTANAGRSISRTLPARPRTVGAAIAAAQDRPAARGDAGRIGRDVRTRQDDATVRDYFHLRRGDRSARAGR